MTGTLAWLYGRDYPGLATALAEAEQGDGNRLRQAADSFYAGIAFGSYVGIVCLDVPHATTTDQIAAALADARKVSARFGPLITLGDQYGCLDWPATTPPPAPIAGPPAGLPPILVIASRWDPATPPWEADALAKALGTGVVLTRDGVGHTSGDANVSSACLRGAVVSYSYSLHVPAAGKVCTAGPPVPWP